MAVDPPCTAQLSMYKIEFAGVADWLIHILSVGFTGAPTALRLFPQMILLLILPTVFSDVFKPQTHKPKPVLFKMVKLVRVALCAPGHTFRPPP